MLFKSLFTVLSLTFALGLSGITTSMIAAPSNKSASKPIADVTKKPPSFLFVVQAKQAVMKPVKDDPYRYTLSMILSDDNLSKVISFSDRPYRIVELMTAKQLHDLWSEGKNSFKVDPPNAVLSAQGFDAEIVILEDQTIEDNVMTFTLKIDSNKVNAENPDADLLDGEPLKSAVLTIDDHAKK